jgi:hypothetical protein
MTAETRSAILDAVAAEVRKRRDVCPTLCAVQVLLASNACGLTQADIDEAFRRAEAS